ncbi:HAD family hydrolase [Nocardioides jiangxiensis]|uniref:HAD family phosphatase n=1 Tax=Nocardioides jiangxiensis TaxID=3064524 RepID=A0ABT9AXT1_9ACTN|nr:HAD family phosphatase [Nocardioides sp. WY-20]MDO7866850.1 HAD family phosphatase [Nocardioides sp. WY-20]
MKHAAVLWDMDGTLVDTEPYWMEAEFDLAERYGGHWTHEHGLALVGNDLLESGRYILRHMFDPGSPGSRLTPEEVVELLLDGVVARVEHAVPWRPGARALLAELLAAGVPCALVTMSYQRFVDPILAELPDGAFAEIVTGDRVSQGKPHPEPYLKAAAGLGLAPETCLAIEDSNTGATSAEAAGCTVLVVECHVPVAPGERRVFRDSLEGLTPADLLTLAP